MTDASQRPVGEIRESLEKAGVLRWFHWCVIALSLGLTLFAWYFSREQLRAKVQIQFDREADQVVELFKERMTKYEDALWAGVAFVSSVDGEVNDQQWARYADAMQLQQKYPGINGIGLIASLNSEEAALFVENEQLSRPDFSIHPAHDDIEFWPIRSIAPLAGNEKAVGLDMAHESNRITAARKARDTRQAQVTAPIVLVQDSRQTPGFLFFAPIYDSVAPDAESSLTTKFSGLVYAPFVFRKLMAGVLDKEKRQVGIRVTDESRILIDEHIEEDKDFDPNPLLKTLITVPLYGRVWQFDIWSSNSFRSSVGTNQPTTILVAGFIIDGMLIGLFLLISRASRASLRLADGMTSDLEKLSLAARVNRIGAWDFDPVSNRLECDEAMFSLFGREPGSGSIDLETWMASIHPDDRAQTAKAIKAALVGDHPFDCEYRVVHPSGEVRYVSAKAVVFRDAVENPIRMLGANSDVTDRKRATLELESTQRMQDAIQEAAGVSIIATDPEGLIMVFNSSAEQMLGYTKDEMVGKQNPGVFHDPDEVVERAGELSAELGREIEPGFEVFVAKAAKGESEQREWTYVRKDGSSLPVLLTITALREHDGTIAGYLGIAADISERKKAIREIESTNASLARSNEELAQFAYVASHDLQEPLRKVNSFCELLKEDCGEELSPSAVTYIGYITDGARRMRSLIQDLLAYSRIETVAHRVTEVDTNAAVQFAIDNLSEAIQESNAIVTVQDLPNIQADPSQIAQLFQNLIGNAIKYHGEAPPQVRVRGEVADGKWLFSVEDNGIGIAPEYREQIFGIFKRLHTQSEYKGTGIGLAVCKRIIDRLGGRIWIESSPSGGAIFRFEFSESDSTKHS